MTASVGFAGIATHVLIEQIIADIKEQYLADATPWIIGFSGGKDSTTLLQLTFFALLELQKENVELHKEIHVLCNDTLVENPAAMAVSAAVLLPGPARACVNVDCTGS